MGVSTRLYINGAYVAVVKISRCYACLVAIYRFFIPSKIKITHLLLKIKCAFVPVFNLNLS